MRRLILPLLVAGVAIGAGRSYLPSLLPTAASQSLRRCSADFAGGAAPYIPGASLTPLCFRHFAVGYSAHTLTPLWSAEKLTASDVEAGWTLHRKNDFHPETALSGQKRAELADYIHSGYDRGHMTPSADMLDAPSQDESFSLANIVPQDRENNRHIWADIEQTVRRIARASGPIYVVTGPIISPQPTRIHDRVAVPVALYKAIYVPGQGAAAYISRNIAARNWRAATIRELVGAGIDPFPGLPESEKGKLLPLPAPFGYHGPH